MANPIVPQGNLNKLRASIQFVSVPGLNITASYLGREMIGGSFEGVATTPIETATGVVYSPEPYQRSTWNVHLLKPQALSAAWKTQYELNTLIGDFVVRPDVGPPGIDPYQISNGVINTINPLKFAGDDAGWVIILSGIYYINSALWNL